jgi:hypothetical protein
VEQAHRPTRVRECVMRRFTSAVSAQRLLAAFGRVGNLFRPAASPQGGRVPRDHARARRDMARRRRPARRLKAGGARPAATRLSGAARASAT